MIGLRTMNLLGGHGVVLLLLLPMMALAYAPLDIIAWQARG
jgi:hypothetical protein